MTALDRRRLGPLAGIAAGGALLGHVLAYAVAFADAAERRAHLVATGHGAFGPLAMLALAVTGAALVLVGVRAARPEPLPGGLRIAVRLAAMQLTMFVLVEVAERGFDLASAARDPAVRLGPALEVVVAAVLAVVLRLFVRAVRLVAVRRRVRQAPPRSLRPQVADRGPLVRTWWASASRRGPPLPLPS